jgi:hypothetical protein
MLLVAAACRLRADKPTRTRKVEWEQQPRRVRFLKNLFDLSVRPASKLDFAARCILLVAFALVCHSLGYGAALFVKAAPLSAAIVFGALFIFATSNWLSRD